MENPIGLQLAGSLDTSQSENLGLKERVEQLEAELKAQTINLNIVSWEHLISNRKWTADLQKISDQEKQIEELEYQLSIITSERALALESCEKLASKVLKYEGNPGPGTVSPLVELQEEIDVKDEKIEELENQIKRLRNELSEVEGLLKQQIKENETLFQELNTINKAQNDLKDQSEPSLQLIQERKQFKEDLESKETIISVQKDQIFTLQKQLDDKGKSLWHKDNNLLAKEATINLQNNCIADLRKQLSYKDQTIGELRCHVAITTMSTVWKAKYNETTIQRKNSEIEDLKGKIDYLIEKKEKNQTPEMGILVIRLHK